MRILVLGATGMAGHTIAVYFKEQGYHVTTLTRRKFVYCSENIIGDVTDFELLERVIQNGSYDGIINAVGILNQDAENRKYQAVVLNSCLPHYLSDLTRNMKTKIIHMSTDCVFSGREGNYSEDSLRDGTSFYDRTKALGELENDKDLTFRNSIVGPDMNQNGIGLFNWFMGQQSPLKGYVHAMWTGVTTLTLAKAMEVAMKEDLTGLYNLVNNTAISKYELLQLFNRFFRSGSLEILPCESVIVDKSLVNNRDDFSFTVPSYEEMIIEMRDWITDHKELYPHYYNRKVLEV